MTALSANNHKRLSWNNLDTACSHPLSMANGDNPNTNWRPDYPTKNNHFTLTKR